MTFVTALALALAVLVALPYAAHRLRRHRVEERPFPAARLVPPAPPKARRRARLEDRALFGTRAAAIVALAVLGASPFVRCSRLSLHRTHGASVALAIVLDDSMSMRAPVERGTRFLRARKAAHELVDSAQPGDAIAIVLAGAPARVALPATTERSAASDALDRAEPSDRSTDLDGALALAGSLVGKLPQVDRRIVVLSDLADGKPDAAPLGEASELPVWIPLDELRGDAPDCAVLRADRESTRVRVRWACSKDGAGAGRELRVFSGAGTNATEVGKTALPQAPTGEVSISVPPTSPDPLEVRLGGADAIATDDVAAVLVRAGPGALGVIANEGEVAATGGAPVLEQALGALQIELALRPIPAVPDHVEDLAGFLGLVIDDPPGFTPEQRHTLSIFASNGGALLVALGPRAAAAPLGATLEPVLGHAISWTASSAKGADATRAAGALAEAIDSLADLGATRRTVLDKADVAEVEMLVPWTDGAPLVAKRALGPAGPAGDAWLVLLPFSLDASDLPLRPGFLALLDAWVAQARAGASPRRSEVGATWTFPLGARVAVTGPSGAVPIAHDVGGLRAAPGLIGAYTVDVDGKAERRVAGPVATEIDLRPRATAKSATGGSVGGRQTPVDASPIVAVVLLALVAAELALRLRRRPRAETAT